MNILSFRFINLKFNSLNISIIISLIIHIFAIFLIKKNYTTDTRGEKYIPIELIDNNSTSGSGESLDKKSSKEQIKFDNTINKSVIKENKSEEIEPKIIESINKQEIIKKSVKKEIKEEIKKSNKENIQMKSDKTKIKMERGNQSNNDKNDTPEKGSVKGIGKVQITCLKCVSPKYPTRALRRGAEGKPVVRVMINKLGIVTKSELLKSSGNESIDNAALLAAQKSKFYPIIKDSILKIEYDLKIRK
tara:strand:- start:241 stop:981 length:741 start_codon:yes stop_codon:yes gene_type:complete